jgi:hypothetical protein
MAQHSQSYNHNHNHQHHHQQQQQQQQRTPPQSSPPSSSANTTTWPPLAPPGSSSAASSTTERQSSTLRHSTSAFSSSSGGGSAAAAAAAAAGGSSGLRGLFNRRSRSQQYQELPHKPVDPQAPRLPKVYLSPPASPELVAQNTTPEKIRSTTSSMNGKTSDYHNKSSTATNAIPNMPPLPDVSTIRSHNRHSVTSTAASLSPRMRRRRRDPTPFNILVIGFLGSGKTSFIRFLKDSLGDSKRIRNVSHMSNEEAAEQNVEEDLTQPPHKTGGFERHYVEKEVDGERVGLTIFDSEGFGPREQNIVDIQLTLLINFITGKFEETFAEVLSFPDLY